MNAQEHKAEAERLLDQAKSEFAHNRDRTVRTALAHSNLAIASTMIENQLARSGQ